MTDLSHVPLTPAQAREVDQADPDLVAAWATAVADPPASVKNPVGWFLNGIRSGRLPSMPTPAEMSGKHQRIEAAEHWVRNAGILFDREAEVEDALFGPHGMLKTWADDDQLVDRLLALWESGRPRGERTESEFSQRGDAARRRNGLEPPAPVFGSET